LVALRTGYCTRDWVEKQARPVVVVVQPGLDEQPPTGQLGMPIATSKQKKMQVKVQVKMQEKRHLNSHTTYKELRKKPSKRGRESVVTVA